MPTPPVNSASTISHFTAGTRQPYSIDADVILRISASGRPPRTGVKPTSCISRHARTNVSAEDHRAADERHAERGASARKPPATEPVSIATPITTWPRANTASRSPVKPVAVERVDEPRLRRAGEEREAEAEQDGDDDPQPEAGLHLPEQDVEQRRRGEHDGAEQVRRAAADGVGDDARRHLEQDHPRRVERVRREGLEVREPRVEQEDRVDAPDQRRREGVPEQQRVVGALDRARRRHARA